MLLASFHYSTDPLVRNDQELARSSKIKGVALAVQGICCFRLSSLRHWDHKTCISALVNILILIQDPVHAFFYYYAAALQVYNGIDMYSSIRDLQQTNTAKCIRLHHEDPSACGKWIRRKTSRSGDPTSPHGHVLT